MPARRARSSRSLRAGTSLPSTNTSPLSGGSKPTTWRRVTLLPVPDGPMSTEISPRGMRQVTPSSTLSAPNDLCTSTSSITASLTQVDSDCDSGRWRSPAAGTRRSCGRSAAGGSGSTGPDGAGCTATGAWAARTTLPVSSASPPEAGQHARADQVDLAGDAHHLEGVDLLVDPHGAQLRDQSASDLGADGEAEKERCDLTRVADRVEDPGQRLGTDLRQRVIRLDAA